MVETADAYELDNSLHYLIRLNAVFATESQAEQYPGVGSIWPVLAAYQVPEVRH